MKQNWQWSVVFIIGFRMFMQTILLEREAYSACWLAPVGGFLIALPLIAVAAMHWQKCGAAGMQTAGRMQWMRLFAAGYLVVDTAQIVLLYQEGTSFASLSTYPTAVLYLLLLFFSLFVLRQPLSGIYGVGTVLKPVLTAGMAALILFRIPDASITRLTPLLGGGAFSLLRASLSLAGYGFVFLIFLACAPDFAPETGHIIGMWGVASAGSALFSAMEVMLSPVAPGEPAGMYLAVGRLLTSGRSQTTLQLVLYMLWFALLFSAVCLNLKCLARTAAGLLKRKEGWAIQLTCILAVMLLSICAEHMMGENLNTFLDNPGAFRSLLLLVPLTLLPARRKKAVSA